MEVPGPAFSDSEDELEMDFSHSPSSYSESTSSYTLDSGISSGVLTGSDSGLSPLEIDAGDEYWTTSPDVLLCLEAQSVLINQALYFLLTGDEVSVTNACAYLFHLCRNGCSSLLMQMCPELITHLLALVRSSAQHCIELLHFLSGILHYFSHSEDGVDLVLNSEGAEMLAIFLESSIDSVLYYTVTTIHNILLVRKSSRDFVRNSCIVDRLINLLKYSAQRSVIGGTLRDHTKFLSEPDNVSPKFLAILCDCLHILAYGHEATKKTFLDRGGIRFLLSLLKDTTYEKLLWTGTRLLRVMSAWLPAKLSVLNEDSSLSFLTRSFGCGSVRVIANALWTLRNLSDVAVDKLQPSVLTSIVEQLLQQLQHVGITSYPNSATYFGDTRDNLALSQCILGILGNITCGTLAVKSQLVQLNGVDLISRVLQSSLSSFHPRLKQPPKGSRVLPESSPLCDSLSNLSLNTATTTAPSSRRTSPERRDHTHNLTTADTVSCSVKSPTSDNLFSYCLPGEISEPSRPMTNREELAHITCSPLDSGHIPTTFHLTRYDPSCPSPLSDIPPPNLNATLDLLEAGFRCLSHLTAGHPKVSMAVSHLFQSRASTQMLTETISHVFLPLLSHYTASFEPSPLRPSLPEPISQLLQLIRAWTMVVHNVHTTCSANGLSNRSKPIHKRHTKPMFSHLRRSLRCLTEQLHRLAELTSSRTKELTVAQELVTRLMSEINAGSSMGTKTSSVSKISS